MVIYLPGCFIMAYDGNQDLQLSNEGLLRIHDEEDFSTMHYFSVQIFVFMNFMVAWLLTNLYLEYDIIDDIISLLWWKQVMYPRIIKTLPIFVTFEFCWAIWKAKVGAASFGKSVALGLLKWKRSVVIDDGKCCTWCVEVLSLVGVV